MVNKKRFNEYVDIVRDRKNISLLSSIFFLILTVLVIGYTLIDSSTLNIVSLILFAGLLLVSVFNLVINQNKLSSIKTDLNKYTNL